MIKMAKQVNHDIPPSIQDIFNDPREDGNGSHNFFVSTVHCLGIQKLLEHRLTKLETQQKLLGIESLAILIGVIFSILELFFK